MLYPDLKELLKLRGYAYPDGISRRQINRQNGEHSSIFNSLGMEFDSVRAYSFGDDARYIDWKVTAKTGEPHVKTFKEECDQNIIIAVDVNSYMRFGTRNTFKSILAARVAALLGWKALAQKDRVGSLLFGDIENGISYIPPKKNDNSVLGFIKNLCQKNIKFSKKINVCEAIDKLSIIAPTRALIFIISDFSTTTHSDLEFSVSRLSRRCKIVLISINDPSDQEIPDIGLLNLENDKTKIIIDTSNYNNTNNYKKKWDEYHESLSRLCRKYSIPILWLNTADKEPLWKVCRI